MAEFCKQFTGQRLYLKIWKQRSPQSNKYYWACCQIIADYIGDLTKERVNTMLLEYFFSDEYVDTSTGEVFRHHPDLSELSQGQQSELIEKMQILAAERWHLVLPDPGEQTRADI